VQYLVAGTRVNATPAERRAAVAILTARSLSAREIAKRINCTRRTVERHRATLAAA
jgi:DNA-binding CsgD family transcriptional regulator